MDVNKDKREFFPVYVRTTGKQVLIVGGGHTATSRVRTLLDFNFSIHVVALEVSPEIEIWEQQGLVKVTRRRALAADIVDPNIDYVVVATDDREANLRFAGGAHYNGKAVNVADNLELCDFLFPAVVTSGNVTAGVAGVGNDFEEVDQAAARIREVL